MAPIASLATGPTRFNMRIAIAATAEWTAAAGGTASAAPAKIVSNLNYANAVYNRDLNVGFTLVSSTNLIYTDPATDPYTNSDTTAMLAQNQTTLDSVIGMPITTSATCSAPPAEASPTSEWSAGRR